MRRRLLAAGACILGVLLVSSVSHAQRALEDEQATATIALFPDGEELQYPGSLYMAGRLDLEDPECRGIGYSPRSSGFVFSSPETEAACGLVSWIVDVPAGAPMVVVSFTADRQVDAPGEATPLVVQEFTIRDQDLHPVTATKALFYEREGSRPAQEFRFLVPLVPGVDKLHMEWWHQDHGVDVARPLTVPAGVSFRSEVSGISLSFLDVGVPGLRSLTPVESHDGGKVVRTMDLQFLIPPSWEDKAGDVRIAVDLEVRGDFDPETLFLPTGEEVSAMQLRVDDETGDRVRVCIVHIPEAWTAAGGTGFYTLRFVADEPAAAFLPGGGAMGFALVAVPVALAVLAFRSITPPASWSRHASTSAVVAAFVAALVWLHGKGGPGVLTLTATAQELRVAYVAAALLTGLSLALLAIAHRMRDRRDREASARMRAELARERASREEAEAALNAVAHDLRSPLVALDHLVAGAADRRGENGPDADLERCQEIICQMDALIQGVSAFAGEARRARKQGKVWVRAMVKEVVGIVEGSSGGKRARITLEPGPDACLDSPPEALRSILLNLVQNAVKYAPETGGIVRVSLRGVDGAGGTGLSLEVADNGPGIPREDRERVFALFTRLPDRHGRTVPGTGVGLALVSRIAHAQGARVRVLDAPEGGALLRVEYPAARVRRWRRADRPPAKGAPARSGASSGSLVGPPAGSHVGADLGHGPRKPDGATA